MIRINICACFVTVVSTTKRNEALDMSRERQVHTAWRGESSARYLFKQIVFMDFIHRLVSINTICLIPSSKSYRNYLATYLLNS